MLVGGDFAYFNDLRCGTLVRLNGDGRFIRLHSIARTREGRIQIGFNTRPGRNYRLESSANLLEWTPVETIEATSITTLIERPAVAKPHQFYRVVLE